MGIYLTFDKGIQGAAVGWKMSCISEQCANNATMCHNLDRRNFRQQVMDKRQSAILTLYQLQLYCFFVLFFKEI